MLWKSQTTIVTTNTQIRDNIGKLVYYIDYTGKRIRDH